MEQKLVAARSHQFLFHPLNCSPCNLCLLRRTLPLTQVSDDREKASYNQIKECFVGNARKDRKAMDFELPEEHQLAYESAFAFARDEIRPHNAEIERSDDFPRWMWKRLADQGYTGIA